MKSRLPRRDFLKLAGVSAFSSIIPSTLAGCGAIVRDNSAPIGVAQSDLGIAAPELAPRPEHHLKIDMHNFDIGDNNWVESLAFNGITPGPVLQFKEGQKTTVKISNNTGHEEVVHWHGFFLPSDVDGAREQGSPMIQPGESLCYTFIPGPSGTRWYHSHAGSGGDFRKGTYCGLSGIAFIDPKNNPGRYDREVFLVMHEWGTSIVGNRVAHK